MEELFYRFSCHRTTTATTTKNARKGSDWALWVEFWLFRFARGIFIRPRWDGSAACMPDGVYSEEGRERERERSTKAQSKLGSSMLQPLQHCLNSRRILNVGVALYLSLSHSLSLSIYLSLSFTLDQNNSLSHYDTLIQTPLTHINSCLSPCLSLSLSHT